MPEDKEVDTVASEHPPVSEAEAVPETGEPQTEPEVVESHRPHSRTRVDEMGIPPIWAVGGEKGKAKEFKKQLAAAEEALEKARAEARDANEK